MNIGYLEITFHFPEEIKTSYIEFNKAVRIALLQYPIITQMVPPTSATLFNSLEGADFYRSLSITTYQIEVSEPIDDTQEFTEIIGLLRPILESVLEVLRIGRLKALTLNFNLSLKSVTKEWDRPLIKNLDSIISLEMKSTLNGKDFKPGIRISFEDNKEPNVKHYSLFIEPNFSAPDFNYFSARIYISRDVELPEAFNLVLLEYNYIKNKVLPLLEIGE